MMSFLNLVHRIFLPKISLVRKCHSSNGCFCTSPFSISKFVILLTLAVLCTKSVYSSKLPLPKDPPEEAVKSSVLDSEENPVPVLSQNAPAFLSTDESRDLPGKVDTGGDESTSVSKTLFFGEDTNGVPIVIGTWFRYGSYTLAFALFGTAFLIACIATSVYYTVFVVTDPSQQQRSSSLPSSPTFSNGMDNWNVGRVLRAIQFAYETYETFDPYSGTCQLKTVCETQEGSQFQGSLLKRLVHFLVYTELVQKKLENAEELRAADRIGNDPRETCKDSYPECRFSLNKIYEAYAKI